MRSMLFAIPWFFSVQLIAQASSGDPSGVLQAARTNAENELATADQRIATAIDQRQTLHQLHQEGAASDLEVISVEVAIRRSEIDRTFAAKQIAWLDNLISAARSANAAITDDFLLIVPPTDPHDQQTHLVSIRVADHPKLRALVRQGHREHKVSSTIKHRHDTPPLIAPFVQFADFRYEGRVIADNVDLLTLAASQQHAIETQKTVSQLQAEQAYLNELDRRLQTIPRTAQLSWENPLLQEARRTNRLRLTAAEGATSSAKWIPAVLTESPSVQVNADVHRTANRSAREENLRQLEQQLATIRVAGNRIESLAADDPFFATEAEQTTLQRKLLEAEIAACHERAKHAVVVENAMRKISEDHSHRFEATSCIFESLAQRHSQRSVLEVRLQNSLRKLNAMRQLLREGFASPVEVRRSEVEVQQRKSAITHFQQQRQRYATITEVLTDVVRSGDS